MDTSNTVNCPPVPALDAAILTFLTDQEMHGYALIGILRQPAFSAIYTSPGHLYCTLYRMVAEGLLTETEPRPAAAAGHALRRYYTATAQGRMRLQHTTPREGERRDE